LPETEQEAFKEKIMIEFKTKFITALAAVALVLCTSAGAVAEGPVDLLKRTSDEVIKILNEQRDQIESDPSLVYKIVDDYIIPHLDDVTMAKLALGKNWRKADNEQKIEFVDQFRTLLVRTYSKSLKEFSDQTIKFYPVNAEADAKKVIVKSDVLQSGGPVIPVSYRMRIKDDAWKVYDINIDGVSLVTSYRGTFAQEMRKGGMDGLLKMLQDKNSKVDTEPLSPDTQTTDASQTAS
jgi:phospholipid transport system substrate-binding protein